MRSNKRASGKRSSRTWFRVVITALGMLVAAGALSWAVETLDAPPRALANHVEHRASGHGATVLAIGSGITALLLWLDRGDTGRRDLPVGIAHQDRPVAVSVGRPGKVVLVATTADAVRAIEQARPGDAVTFMPGTYRFTGRGIVVNRAGSAAAAITVRADRPGTVMLEFDMAEGFIVSEPYWTFENLGIRGVCARHADCEHAFHVVSRAHHFIARNNHVSEFNAHFKINGAEAVFPDDGMIEANTLSNSSVRETDSSVTPIDLVAASHWTMRGNRITDFSKAGSDRVSYGAFAKGGGSGNVFEQNIVLCENHVRGAPGQRIGIALGGGGTGKEYCRDRRCITEQDGGVVRSNLVMACSDDGIYINRSATSQVKHNTLIDTGGITVRFVESSADVEGNLVDGAIRSRDGGSLHAIDNIDTPMTRLYLGLHPVRGLFQDLAMLAWAADPPRRRQPEPPSRDLCGTERTPNATYGAFEDFSKCGLGAFPGTSLPR